MMLWGLAALVALSSAECRPAAAHVATPTAPAAPARWPDSTRVDTVRYGRFGPVVLYRHREHPSQVVLFVSGDGGWNRAVVGMAEDLATMDALVVGIDIRRYLNGLAAANEPCSYPAADFEALSQWLQHMLGFPRYVLPVLVGHSSGATLVYATLAQSPPNTFRGGISLGFCPDLRATRRFCRGAGLVSSPGNYGRGLKFGPVDSMPAPWVVLEGEIDSTCGAAQAAAFVRRIRGAAITLLPKVGHGFGVESHWLPQLRAAFSRIIRSPVRPATPAAPAVRDLPLIELPSGKRSPALAVVISGDGGWASLDRQIGETFAAHGVSVVGLNSLEYFWKPRTPVQAAADLTRILRHYLQAWKASEVVLVGYSRGADVLPFMVARLPDDLRQRIRTVALLGVSLTAGFEFHLSDLLGATHRGDRPTVPEIARLHGLRVLCVYGTDETDSACPDLPRGLATLVVMPGGHHFEGAYRDIAARILRAAAMCQNPAKVSRRRPPALYDSAPPTGVNANFLEGTTRTVSASGASPPGGAGESKPPRCLRDNLCHLTRVPD
jgi:type IV secretory pathway VirJ component